MLWMDRRRIEDTVHAISAAVAGDSRGDRGDAYGILRDFAGKCAAEAVAEAKAEQDKEWIASLRDHVSKGWPKSGRHLFDEGCKVCRALSPPVAAQ